MSILASHFWLAIVKHSSLLKKKKKKRQCTRTCPNTSPKNMFSGLAPSAFSLPSKLNYPSPSTRWLLPFWEMFKWGRSDKWNPWWHEECHKVHFLHVATVWTWRVTSRVILSNRVSTSWQELAVVFWKKKGHLLLVCAKNRSLSWLRSHTDLFKK